MAGEQLLAVGTLARRGRRQVVAQDRVQAPFAFRRIDWRFRHRFTPPFLLAPLTEPSTAPARAGASPPRKPECGPSAGPPPGPAGPGDGAIPTRSADPRGAGTRP